MSNQNRTFCALVARRDFLADWLADFTTKIESGTALTETEQYEYTYLREKQAELARDVVKAMQLKPIRHWNKFVAEFLKK